MPKQLWQCEECKKRGYVTHAHGAGPMVIAYGVLTDHKRVSPICDNAFDQWELMHLIKTPKEPMMAPDNHVHCVHCNLACVGPLRCEYCEIDIEQGRMPGTPWEPYCPGVSQDG